MGAAGCSGSVPRSCSDRVAGWGGADDDLRFPAGPGCVMPGLPSTSTCCAAFPARSRGTADQDRVVLLPRAVDEQGYQCDVAPVDTWNIHGAECNPTGDDTCPDGWSLPDEVGIVEGGDGVKLARAHMYEPSLSADEDNREGDSDDRSKADVEAALPSTDNSPEAVLVTDETAQVSAVVPGTDLHSQESLSVLLTSAHGSPCISDREELPTLLISGPYGHCASASEIPDKVSLASDAEAIVDSATASDATKYGAPEILGNSSVDIALQEEGQVRQASEILEKPSSATIPFEEPAGGGSPQRWPGIDRDNLHHISDMNLRPPRSRRTRQPSGRASITDAMRVARGASGDTRHKGTTRNFGGSNGVVLPTLSTGAMGKRVEELLLW